ncbi:MAG: hypothetical protein JWP20_432 [Roseomonas sp.]|nr:hypothetical protein [Roseomonas sp.]
MNGEFITIAEASAKIASRQISPVELTRQCLDRVEALDSQLHSFIRLTPDRAMADARKAEAEIAAHGPKGPLHGIPIGLKDIIDTAGIPTTCQSRLLRDNQPAMDATSAARLADAGTILLGKMTTHEFADGGPSFDLPWPPARNPWNPAHFTAGSSSGTGAAIAAGMILGGPGTDTGGSIRGPAALCGIAGLKPTYGLVSRAGVAPAAYSLDHIGPMAWTVEDCAILLQAMAGHDPADPASARRPVPDYMAGLRGGVAGLRVGVIHHFHEVDYPVTEATRGGIDTAIATLRDLGAVIQETTLSPLADWSACGTLISITERAAAYEPWMRERLSEFSSVLRDRLMLSSMVSAVDYVQALRRRRELCLELALAMANVDILLTATQRAEAPLIDAISRWDNIERPNFTMPFNVAGVPAISVCSGFGAGDLPVAVQMIAKPFQEALLLRAAHAYEQAAGWRGRRPSLAKAVLAA